jgi:hypothetical protein
MTYDPSKFYPTVFEGQGWVNTIRHGAAELGVAPEDTELVLEPAFYQELGVDRTRVDRYDPVLTVDEANAEFVYAAAEAVLAVKGIRGAWLRLSRNRKTATDLITNLNISNFREWQAAAQVASWAQSTASEN